MSMFLYDAVFFLHILAAVMGLGTAFGFPIMARAAKTTIQARYTLELFRKLEILPKAGSVALLLTGLLMALLEPSLWTKGWFIASLVLYIVAQVLVIGFLPKGMRRQAAILEGHVGDNLPAEYRQQGKQTARIEGITQVLAVILIWLMVFKPF